MVTNDHMAFAQILKKAIRVQSRREKNPHPPPGIDNVSISEQLMSGVIMPSVPSYMVDLQLMETKKIRFD